MGGKSTRVVVRCGASIQMGGPCTNIVTPIFPDIAISVANTYRRVRFQFTEPSGSEGPEPS
jgi:hypothetical protein